MYRIILRLAYDRRGKRLHGKFEATLNGRQRCVSRQPLLDVARALIVEGVAPEAPITTRHAGAYFDAMISVGEAAKLTVEEGGKVGPRFARWKALSPLDIQSPVRFDEWPTPDTRRSTGRIHESNAA